MCSSNDRPIFHEKMKPKSPDKTPEPLHFFNEDFDRQLKATLIVNVGTVIVIFFTNTSTYKIDNEGSLC